MLLPSLALRDCQESLFKLGESLGRMGQEPEKAAGDAETAHSLAGRLYLSDSGWLLMSVPNALARGAFAALDETGIELPFHSDGTFDAHVSVMRPEEIEQLGGPDKLRNDRGKVFHYTLGPVKTVTPKGWAGVSRVWYITVNSPELRELRRSYGLSSQPNEDWDFHITVARRRVGVNQENELSKAAILEPFDTEAFASACKSSADADVPAEIRKLQLGGELPKLMPGYGYCRWDADARRVHLVSGDSDENEAVNAWIDALKAIEGVREVTCESEYTPKDMQDKQRIPEPGHAVYSDRDLTKLASNMLITLRRIKEFSDAKKYKAKEKMLRRLMLANPQEWLVDQPAPYHPGVTHLPTGFRYHTTRRGIPVEVPVKAAESPLATLPRAMVQPLSQGPATGVDGRPLPAWQQALAMPGRIGMHYASRLTPSLPIRSVPPSASPASRTVAMPPMKRASHVPQTMAEQALWTTPIQINAGRGLIANLGDHLTRLRNNFRSQVANRRFQSDLRVAADPAAGWERLHQIAQGVDPFVDNQLDRTLSQLVG